MKTYQIVEEFQPGDTLVANGELIEYRGGELPTGIVMGLRLDRAADAAVPAPESDGNSAAGFYTLSTPEEIPFYLEMHGVTIFTISPKGVVTVNTDIPADEAARNFWNAVAAINPLWHGQTPPFPAKEELL